MFDLVFACEHMAQYIMCFKIHLVICTMDELRTKALFYTARVEAALFCPGHSLCQWKHPKMSDS